MVNGKTINVFSQYFHRYGVQQKDYDSVVSAKSREGRTYSARNVKGVFWQCAAFMISRQACAAQETTRADNKVLTEALDPKHREWKWLVGSTGKHGAMAKWSEEKVDQTHDLFAWMDLNPDVEVELGKEGKTCKISEISSVTYFSEKEAASFEAVVEDGIWKYLGGKLIDTSDSKQSPNKKGNLGDGYGVIVVDSIRRIYVHDYIPGKLHHTSTTHGKAVHTVGLVKIKQGELQAFDCASGHYRCGLVETKRLCKTLHATGVNLARVDIKSTYLKGNDKAQFQQLVDTLKGQKRAD